MAKYDLISPRAAREDVKSNDALLVCAYENEEKYKKAPLDKAISLQEFINREEGLAKDREVIFYCG